MEIKTTDKVFLRTIAIDRAFQAFDDAMKVLLKAQENAIKAKDEYIAALYAKARAEHEEGQQS